MRRRLLITLAALLPAILAADTPHDLAQRGVAQLAAGRYSEALASFDAALAADPTAVELWHNRAAALLQLGRFDEARQVWDRIRDQSDAGFEARMVYNLGNCDYAEALTLADAAPPRARKLLQSASDRYVDALRIDPTLADARANLELAQLLMRQLESQEPPPEKEEGDPSKPPESDPSSRPTSQPSEPQSPQEAEPNQPQPSDEPPPPDASQSPPKPPDSPPAEAPPGELPSTEPPAPAPAEEVGMTPDLAQRLLQIVRDAEKARREELARRNPQRHRPADRDW